MHELLGKFCGINIKKGRYREWCVISSNNRVFPNSILKQTVVILVVGKSRGRKVFAFLNTGMWCWIQMLRGYVKRREGIILAGQAFSWSCYEQAVVRYYVLWRAEGVKERKQSMF